MTCSFYVTCVSELFILVTTEKSSVFKCDHYREFETDDLIGFLLLDSIQSNEVSPKIPSIRKTLFLVPDHTRTATVRLCVDAPIGDWGQLLLHLQLSRILDGGFSQDALWTHGPKRLKHHGIKNIELTTSIFRHVTGLTENLLHENPWLEISILLHWNTVTLL